MYIYIIKKEANSLCYSGSICLLKTGVKEGPNKGKSFYVCTARDATPCNFSLPTECVHTFMHYNNVSIILFPLYPWTHSHGNYLSCVWVSMLTCFEDIMYVLQDPPISLPSAWRLHGWTSNTNLQWKTGQIQVRVMLYTYLLYTYRETENLKCLGGQIQ